MTAPVATTTVDALYAAILQTAAASFGDIFVTMGPYNPETLLTPGAQIRTPALYLEIEDASSDAQADARKVLGTTALTVTMTLHVVLTTSVPAIRLALPQVTADPQIALDTLASAVLALVRLRAPDTRLAAKPGNDWNLSPAVTPAGTAVLLMIDWGLTGYGIRPVRWDQTIFLPPSPIACLGLPQ